MSILLCVKCACRAKFCSYLTNKLYCRKIKSKLNRDRKIKKYNVRVWVSHPTVILSVVEGSSVAKRTSKICALRLDVSESYSQLLCLRIETCGFAFLKALLREYIRYATLASKLLRFALTQWQSFLVALETKAHSKRTYKRNVRL